MIETLFVSPSFLLLLLLPSVFQMTRETSHIIRDLRTKYFHWQWFSLVCIFVFLKNCLHKNISFKPSSFSLHPSQVAWTSSVASRGEANPPAGEDRTAGARHHPPAACVYLRMSVPSPARLALPRRWFELHLGLARLPDASRCCYDCEHAQDDQWPFRSPCVLPSCLFLSDLMSSLYISFSSIYFHYFNFLSVCLSVC